MSLFPVSRMQTELVARSLLITTSWDDGHRSDLRFADLPEKGGLSGTFYVPSTNSACRPVMRPTEFAQLGQRFQIGGHTQDHISLTETPLPGGLWLCPRARTPQSRRSGPRRQSRLSVCACSEGSPLGTFMGPGRYVVIHFFGEAFPGAIAIVPTMSNLPILITVNISTSNVYRFSYFHERAWAALTVLGLLIFVAVAYVLSFSSLSVGIAVAIAVITREGVVLVMSAGFLVFGPTGTQLSSIQGGADAEASNATASPILAPRARGASSRRDQLRPEHR
jgi:hypothetical protein